MSECRHCCGYLYTVETKYVAALFSDYQEMCQRTDRYRQSLFNLTDIEARKEGGDREKRVQVQEEQLTVEIQELFRNSQ